MTDHAPQRARTTAALERLERDNVAYGDFWMLIDEATVSMTRQKVGEFPTEKISIPRHVFDKFVRWYTTGDADMRKR